MKLIKEAGLYITPDKSFLCKLISECLEITLDEAVQVDGIVKKVIQNFNLTLPDEKMVGIDDVKPSSKNKSLASFKDLKSGKIIDSKPGKIFKTLFPNLRDDIIRDMVAKYMSYIGGGEFKEFKNVTEWYSKCGSAGISSCMVGETNLTKFYDDLKDVTVLVLFNGDKPFGRALIWRGAEGGGKAFMDRVYPSDNSNIVQMFQDYAKKQGWTFRKGTGYNDFDTAPKMKYIVKGKIGQKFNIPYMDTFRFGYFDKTDIIMINYRGNNVDYYTFNSTSGVKLVIPDPDNMVWKGGIWKNGLWKNGLWKNGTWKDGTWKNGIWEAGIWEGGIWEKGTWKNGLWKNGTWENGTWEGGVWEDGVWKDGLWERGIWEDGVWKDGLWERGIWERGIWKNGTWKNGTWKNGTWESGVWEDGLWKNGIWKNGIWDDGIWEDGTWKNGIWEGGIWEKGTWKNGIWKNGTWKNGTWEGGVWKNGTWENGKWKEGWIYDPQKKGNFKPTDKWDRNYVQTSLNPTEYFKK